MEVSALQERSALLSLLVNKFMYYKRKCDITDWLLAVICSRDASWYV